jgi:hypothetical protein
LENETITFSKHWKISRKYFQALEKSRPFFPSLGKRGAYALPGYNQSRREHALCGPGE